jgi:hypothetical protein
MDYTKVLGQLREARKLGLQAPVLLMGTIYVFRWYLSMLI